MNSRVRRRGGRSTPCWVLVWHHCAASMQLLPPLPLQPCLAPPAVLRSPPQPPQQVPPAPSRLTRVPALHKALHPGRVLRGPQPPDAAPHIVVGVRAAAIAAVAAGGT